MPATAASQACFTARTNATLKGYRATYEDGTIDTFDGYVMGCKSSGAVDGKVPLTISIEITGAVTRTPAA